jgi:hypothetical protein
MRLKLQRGCICHGLGLETEAARGTLPPNNLPQAGSWNFKSGRDGPREGDQVDGTPGLKPGHDSGEDT